MSSKIAFLSDIHGNSPALQAVLDDIKREGCAKAFMLGDIINGIDPHGCVQILRSWSETNRIELACIKGNAEAYLVTPDRELLIQQSDAYRISSYRVDVLKLMHWYESRLSRSDLDWIYSLPDTIRWNGVYLVHDSPMDRLAVQAQTDFPPQYRELNYHGRGITRDMTKPDWEKLIGWMRSESLGQVFCGHTHSPFYREMEGLVVCNIGSAGMPLDGDPRPSWAMMVQNDSGVQSIFIRRVAYDISATLRLIDSTPDYYDFHLTGYQEAYKKMFLNGNHWRNYMPK